MAGNIGVAVPVAQWPQIMGSQDSLSMNGLGMPPEIALKEQAINRKQQLANVLMQRALQPAQGQMAGRFYVPPSWAQGVAQLGAAAAGVGLTRMNENRRQELSDQSNNMLSEALKSYRDKTAPYQEQTKAADERSVNGSGVSPQLPYGIDPNVMPSQGFDPAAYQWGQDPTQQVQDNKNAIAMNTPQPQEQPGPLAGVPQQMNPWTTELVGQPNSPAQQPPLVDALQQRYDQGEQYTRQPFQQPQSQVTVSGPEFAMKERTPQERQTALVDLMASQHPKAAAIGQMLMQQEQQRQQHDLQTQQALLMEKLKEQAALNLKQTPSADTQAEIGSREKLHGVPSGNAILGARDQVVTTDANGNLVENKPVVDAKMKISEAGRPSTVTNIQNFTPLNQELQKEGAKKLIENYDKLRDVPAQIENLTKARALIGKSEPFVGSFGEKKLSIATFFNNNLGTNINPEAIANANELRTRVFQNVMDNLKKMDAQPSQYQQKIMMDALGDIDKDPRALDRMLNAYEDVLRSKVEIHNKTVEGMKQSDKTITFPYDVNIAMPKREQQKQVVRTGKANGRKVVEYSDGSVEYAE